MDQEEARFIALTKVRLEDLRRRQSLEELAVHYVAHNIDIFCEQNKLEILPVQVREKILQRVLQFICLGSNGNPELLQKLMKALPQLLSPHTRKVDLGDFLSFRPENSALIQVFGWIAGLAPNVEELSLSKVGVRIIGVQQSLLLSLSQMKKLSKLLLNVTEFRFSDLSKLCGDLPCLQVASVGALWLLEHDLVDGSDHKRNLQNLRVLEVKQWRAHHRDLLASVAPHLDYIVAQNWEYLPLASDEKETPPFLKRRFLTLGEQGVPDEWHELPLKYPNITHLLIEDDYFEVQSIEPVLHFKKVEALILDGVRSWVIVKRILAAFGHQLRSLAILCEHPSEFRAFERISLLCPKLEKLCLVNVLVPDTTKEVFPELTELTWIHSRPIQSASSVLRCAPKLQRVRMNGVFNLSDLIKCTKMIEKGDALRELRSLSVVLEHTSNAGFNQKHFSAAARMVKTASAFLPELVEFHFVLNHDFWLRFGEGESVPLIIFHLDTCNKLLKEYNKHNGVFP